MSRVRWTCEGDHPGVLAPRRLRKIDIRRYCLECSVAAGVLVERSAPAVERKRQERQHQRASAAKRQRASNKRRREARKQRNEALRAEREASKVEVAGDLQAELERIWPLACALSSRDDIDPNHPPMLKHRIRSDARVSGRARYDASRIVISVGKDADAAAALGTLAHEVAHAVAPMDEHHGPGFWALLVDLVRVAYDARADLTQQTTGWGRQLVVEQAIREARR